MAEKKLYDDYLQEWDGHECPLVTPYTRAIGIRDQTLEKLWRVRQHDTDNGPIPINIGPLIREETKLKAYQLQAVAHLMLMPRLILGDAVGLGKTLSAISAACYHVHKDPATRVIVFTTKSALYQWDKEIKRFSHLRSWVLRDKYGEETGNTARLTQIQKFLAGEKKDVLVCKYTSLIGKRVRIKHYFDVNGQAVDDPENFEGQLYDTRGDPVRYGAFEKISPEIVKLAGLLKNHPGQIILVFDEAHKFKTTTGQLRNMILYLQRHATRVWAMTATAIKNNLDEFYSIASAIGVRPLGAISKFREEHVLYTQTAFRNGGVKKTIRGYKGVKKFVDNIRPFFYGRSQRQVKEKLPRLQTVYHRLELTDVQAKLLLEDIPNGDFILPPTIKKIAGEWVMKERDVDNDMTMLSVYQLVANHQALLDPHDEKAFLTKELSPKEEALLDLLDGELAGEKVIVYAQPLDAKVLTPSGWRLMGELRIGDAVVDPDGGIGFVEGIYPKGINPVYEVKTRSGAKTRCCADHLWLVQTRYDRNKHTGNWRLYDTRKLLKRGGVALHGKNGSVTYKYALPIPAPVEFEFVQLPLPAYTLGVLLSDGDISRSAASASADEEIVERVSGDCFDSVAVKKYRDIHYDISTTCASEKDSRGYDIKGANDYKNVLEQLGLLGSHANSKFIPRLYLQSSVDDRLALLRGLMDTDGTCNRRTKQFSYSTVSKQLALDVAELVRSLGGLASIYGPAETTYAYKGIKQSGQDYWTVGVWMNQCPFSLKRKAELWQNRPIVNSMASIEPAGEVETQCIRVSTKRHLYITDDYIVTHNTKGRNWIDRLQWLTENGHFSRRKFLRITGAENEKKREAAKTLFQEEDEYDLIFINNAAIEAINLQQAAHMVCLDMPWSWGDTTQLVGRMLRLASPHSACTLHVMYAAGTVDEYTIEVLRSKKGLFEKIFGESFSAGLLDDSEAQEEIDLSSGIDTVRDQSEFRDLLKAHVKPVKLRDFVSGDALDRQKRGGRETLLERGKKPKVSIEEMALKWR